MRSSLLRQSRAGACRSLASWSASSPSARRGRVQLWILLGTLAIALGAWGYTRWFSSAATAANAATEPSLVVKVSRGPFEYFVVERGELESASNIDIRCQVKARGGGNGTAILKIVSEGTIVKKGDLLVQFDEAGLQNDLLQQRGYVAKSRAAKIEAASALATAKAALGEYTNGTFRQELELARSAVFVAEENLRRAEEFLRYAERQAGRGYITAVQLDAERFAVKKTRKELEAAQTKVDVLEKHTYPKMEAQLTADVAKTSAQLTAADQTLALDERQEEYLLNQITRCRIIAPHEGQVVYATANDRNRDEQLVIEEGVVIREGQTVIRLPDTAQMRVRAQINEARINLIKLDTPVTVELDAVPGVQYRAVVRHVDPFPLPRRWMSGVKEYGALIDIVDERAGLRPGLRAKLRIFVDRQDDVLQVPIQSVVERGGATWCVVQEGDDWKQREVTIGGSNDSFVVINKGLQAGEPVALNPRPYLEKSSADEPEAADRPQRRRPPGDREGTAKIGDRRTAPAAPGG